MTTYSFDARLRGPASLHTEMKALADLAGQLQPGDNVQFTGESEPCHHCRASMNEAAARLGHQVTISYSWGDRTWRTSAPHGGR